MRRSSYRRLCALLAAAEVRQSDFLELARALAQRSPESVYQDVLKMRALLSLFPDDGADDVVSATEGGSTDEVGEKVQRLLFDEARLSRSEAYELLSMEILNRHPAIALPGMDPKKGFAHWVRKVANVVPDSELLHIVTTIRNSFVHERPQDWRLK